MQKILSKNGKKYLLFDDGEYELTNEQVNLIRKNKDLVLKVISNRVGGRLSGSRALLTAIIWNPRRYTEQEQTKDPFLDRIKTDYQQVVSRIANRIKRSSKKTKGAQIAEFVKAINDAKFFKAAYPTMVQKDLANDCLVYFDCGFGTKNMTKHFRNAFDPKHPGLRYYPDFLSELLEK